MGHPALFNAAFIPSAMAAESSGPQYCSFDIVHNLAKACALFVFFQLAGWPKHAAELYRKETLGAPSLPSLRKGGIPRTRPLGGIWIRLTYSPPVAKSATSGAPKVWFAHIRE
jgi:hypothetical protein